MKLQPLTKFLKKNLWLAVVPQKDRLLVAGADEDPGKALDKAKKAAGQEAYLMKSALNYGIWAPGVVK